MKKVVLSAFVCLMGLSAQASQDCQTEADHKQAWKNWEDARQYFQGAETHITRENIRDAMQQFPNFLQWTYPSVGNALITHLVVRFGDDANVLRYLLGFSPDLNFTDGSSGRRPEEMCNNQELKKVFEEYRRKPWRHPDTVFDLPVDHEEYICDCKRFGEKEDLIERGDDPSSQIAVFSNVFDKKVLGVLGAMILSGLLYWYNANKDKEQAAA